MGIFIGRFDATTWKAAFPNRAGIATFDDGASETRPRGPRPTGDPGGPPVRENAMPVRMAFDDAEVAELHRVIDYYRERGEDPPYSGRFEEEFCDAFVEFQGAKGFADAVTSGTAACYIALAALDLPP